MYFYITFSLILLSVGNEITALVLYNYINGCFPSYIGEERLFCYSFIKTSLSCEGFPIIFDPAYNLKYFSVHFRVITSPNLTVIHFLISVLLSLKTLFLYFGYYVLLLCRLNAHFLTFYRTTRL